VAPIQILLRGVIDASLPSLDEASPSTENVGRPVAGPIADAGAIGAFPIDCASSDDPMAVDAATANVASARIERVPLASWRGTMRPRLS